MADHRAAFVSQVGLLKRVERSPRRLPHALVSWLCYQIFSVQRPVSGKTARPAIGSAVVFSRLGVVYSMPVEKPICPGV